MLFHSSTWSVAQITLTSVALLGTANAYYIDESCTRNQVANIKLAIDEAQRVARYAAWRIDQSSPPVGDAAEQLLGDNAVAQLKDKMTRLPDTIGGDLGSWDPDSPGTETTLIVKCGNAHLLFDVQKGGWIDPEFGDMGPIASANPPAAPCSPGAGEYARTNWTGILNNGPRSVIMLCEGYATAALSREASLRKTWATRDWTGVPFNRFSNDAMSVTMLHELLHTMWFIVNGRVDFSSALTGRLPGNLREQYDWASIKALTDEQKQKNVHSYTMLAFALWLKHNEIGSDGKIGLRHPAEVRAGPELNMPDDPHY